MSKSKVVYICSDCGSNYPKWMGRCTSCGSWNSLQEEVVTVQSASKRVKIGNGGVKKQAKPVLLREVDRADEERLHTGIGELDRVLGGGLVEGAVVLVGGQPGIGKSTLLLQMALGIGRRVLYVSGEESMRQIKMRADRLGGNSDNCWILSETETETIVKQIRETDAELVIIDSIQTLSSRELESAAGTITQIRTSAQMLSDMAKQTGIPLVLIGHITKEGSLAGPKLLEHMVDVVLQFEGENQYAYRILRTMKNRFGSTDEIGLFEMRQEGMREVENPSELLISQSEEIFSGSAVAATLEGMRPMLIEVQGLVGPAVYGNPQRSATGFDLRRLSMLLAVLEKRAGFIFGQQDVFLNMAGGLKVNDPGTDLGVVAALMSSFQDIPLQKSDCFAGEVGLSGEIRPIHRVEQRIMEADRLGFKRIILSSASLKGLNRQRFDVKCVGIGRVEELQQLIEN